jgi:hypothetical protein
MINDFGAYAEDFDFKRRIYLKPEQINNRVTKPSIKDKVFAELRKREPEENKVLVITGPPGVGKSVLLRRLAYDVSTTGHAPVIIFDRTRSFFDLKLLSSSALACPEIGVKWSFLIFWFGGSFEVRNSFFLGFCNVFVCFGVHVNFRLLAVSVH